MVKLLKFPITTAVDTGTTSATSTGQIVDSGQNFETSVRIGDKVTMTVSKETALVTKVIDDDTLDISADIAVSGEAFTISRIDHLLAPVGEGILCDIKSNVLVELFNAGHYSHHIKITATGANSLLADAVNAAQISAAETVWTEVVFEVKVPEGTVLTAYTTAS
jgi:hypothetical protein